MKIAFFCSDAKKRAELVKTMVVNWEGVFSSPVKTALDEEVEWPERFSGEEYTKKHEAEKEVDIYKRMLFLSDQFDRYKEVKNIVYSGCPLDLVAETLLAFDKEEVSEDFVDAVIRRNKDIVRNLDLIYYQPVPLDKIEDEEEQKKEQVYYAIVSEYLDEDTSSGVFPATDCPGVVVLESQNPVNEIREIVGKDGSLTGDDSSPAEMQRLLDSLKDPRIKEHAKTLLQEPSIPLVGGGYASPSSIEF